MSSGEQDPRFGGRWRSEREQEKREVGSWRSGREHLPLPSPRLDIPNYHILANQMVDKIRREGLLAFNRNDLYLHPKSPATQYARRLDEEKTVVHWGQLKLYLATLEFICLYCNKMELPKPKVVYAGSAPGYNISILSEQFPEIEWDLWDPAPFGIRPVEGKINIFNTYFTDDVAMEYAREGDRILFISDIRTVNSTEVHPDVAEREVWSDMIMQQNWVKIINPYRAHLKFRLPFQYQHNEDQRLVRYLNGDVLFQAYVGPTSTETRLVPVKINDMYQEVDWDAFKYESQMFYFNTVIREKARYKVPISGLSTIPDDDELYNNYDGCYFIYVLDLYLQYQGYTVNISEEERFNRIMDLTIYVRRELAKHRKYGKTIRDIGVYNKMLVAERKKRGRRKTFGNLDEAEDGQIEMLIDDLNVSSSAPSYSSSSSSMSSYRPGSPSRR